MKWILLLVVLITCVAMWDAGTMDLMNNREVSVQP